MSTLRKFIDVDLTFEPHPATKDLMIRTNENAVKNSIKNLVLTRHYEKPFHSEIGSSVMGLLFNQADPSLIALLKREITQTIENFEPRARILNVAVNLQPDQNSLDVKVYFGLLDSTTPLMVAFTLDRTM